MTKAQWTDFLRAILKSKGRYISLIFIVALGTAFFTGVRSAEPDMTASADRYYDETSLMDVRILGTLGLTEDDLIAIANTDGILHAEGGHATEALSATKNDTLVVNVMSLSEHINQMTITAGRLPKNENECFLDASVMNAGNFKLGDTFVMTGENGDAHSDLKHGSYTIVGYGTWSWYLSWTRGSASIGDGSLDGFVVVPKTAFDMDCYTVIYATVQDVKNLNSFSKAYEEAINLVTERIEEIASDRCTIRYTQLFQDASKLIEDAKTEIKKGEQQLLDAKKLLTDAEAEYEESVKKLEDGRMSYNSNLQAFKDGQEKLKAAKAELDAGKTEYQNGLVAYAEGQKDLEKAKEELAAKKLELEAKTKEYEDAVAEYQEARVPLDEALAILETKQQEFDTAQAQYEAGRNEYDAKKAELDAAKTALDNGWTQLANAEADLKTAQTLLDKFSGSLDTNSETYRNLYAELQAAQATLERERTGLVEKQAQYDAAQEQMQAASERLASAAAELEENEAILEAAWEEVAPFIAEMEAAQAQLDDAKAQLDAGRAAIANAQQQIADGELTLIQKKQELEEASVKITEGEATYLEGMAELETSQEKLNNARAQLNKAEADLQQAREDINAGWSEYYAEVDEAEQKLEEARQEVADGEQNLSELDEGQWYVLGRDSIQTSVEYGLDAERIGAIGDVLPIIFFLVAALVSLTTMTRMVEEERTLIGTMKALGYDKMSIAAKYILYAFSATLIGGILGVIIGSKFLPYVIMVAYGMLYSNVQYTLLPLHWELCITAISLAMLCTVGAAYFACYKELRSTPAALMRPPVPKQGKRVFLENFPGIWNKLNFSTKATIRNLIRYKKRFFMTVFGIGGCMAILLACFGLRDSISVIAKKQYQNVWTYSAALGIDENVSAQEQNELLASMLAQNADVESGLSARYVSVDVSSAMCEKSVHLYVIPDTENLHTYLNLHDRETQTTLELSDNGVVLSEKLANMLGVGPGDTFSYHVSSTNKKDVTVLGLAENYTGHCLYMTAAQFESLYGHAPLYNILYLEFAEGMVSARQQELASQMLTNDAVTSVTLVKDSTASLNDMVSSLNMVVWVMIVASGLLAFVVLFNLNNINISERRRELATLKVLGFYDKEVAMYVYRENIILTIFGIGLGLVMGSFLHRYLVSTLEVDLIMFGRSIEPISFVSSIVLTALFALLVNIAMYYKLQEIDMIESLKSVE